ncbi:divergent polysaccharide deacetylase family protein [Halocynthiibacter sp. C4]|uniref:divergent polysaccharide deacetylase family protein n=1 Tax=Halocynthiibacter sp. C4 TaxID=2992758 RepID=UPI00237B997D|nr:divergent polysaccharide deacetylase family protein [Halocynthiibacter sp. C4]MDE0589789.1 divergent polysaccharide deacetylase family protein [Halocynthiibacter sp. C4]
MQGFLKGAILGLFLAVVIFVVAAVLAPPVDQAKHSEPPASVVDQDVALAAPDLADVPAVSTEAEKDARAGATPARPEAPAPDDGSIVIPEPTQKVAVATEEPSAPVAPSAIEAPDAKPVTESTTLPETVKIAEAAPEQSPEVSTVPDTPPAPEALKLPQIAPDAPEAEEAEASEERQTVRIDARENPVLRNPEPEAGPEEELPRIQSEAESENAPPNALVRTPDAPRAIGKRVSTFSDRAETVLTNRLPSIGRESEEATGSALQNPSKPNALRDNSQGFTDTGLPIVSLVLLDEGVAETDLAGFIEAMGVPVSVAIDPLSERSAERAAAYYDAGAEILAMPAFPQGATAQDVEVNLGQGLSILQNAVAVLPKPGSSMPPRTSLAQVTAIASATGHGIVAQKMGLNSIGQLADRAGVPNTLIQRVVEPKTTPESLRAQMNRAIFRASQDGSVVVLAHADDATLSALLEWGVADRPASITMAPVSAVLGAGSTR